LPKYWHWGFEKPMDSEKSKLMGSGKLMGSRKSKPMDSGLPKYSRLGLKRSIPMGLTKYSLTDFGLLKYF